MPNINPYMLYIKLSLAAVVIAGLFWLGWHEMSIRAELKAKTAEAALQKATTEMYAKEFNDFIKLNKGIADELKNIKIHSNNYIQTIESSPPPDVADGSPVVLVPAGMPNGATLPDLSIFQNRSATRTTASPSRDTGNQTGQ